MMVLDSRLVSSKAVALALQVTPRHVELLAARLEIPSMMAGKHLLRFDPDLVAKALASGPMVERVAAAIRAADARLTAEKTSGPRRGNATGVGQGGLRVTVP